MSTSERKEKEEGIPSWIIQMFGHWKIVFYHWDRIVPMRRDDDGLTVRLLPRAKKEDFS